MMLRRVAKKEPTPPLPPPLGGVGVVEVEGVEESEDLPVQGHRRQGARDLKGGGRGGGVTYAVQGAGEAKGRGRGLWANNNG